MPTDTEMEEKNLIKNFDQELALSNSLMGYCEFRWKEFHKDLIKISRLVVLKISDKL